METWHIAKRQNLPKKGATQQTLKMDPESASWSWCFASFSLEFISGLVAIFHLHEPAGNGEPEFLQQIRITYNTDHLSQHNDTR